MSAQIPPLSSFWWKGCFS